MEIVAAQFFAKDPSLVLLLCDQSEWSSCTSDEDFEMIVIDGSLGPYFNTEWVDINNDGRKDLLVTNNRDDGKGAVFAYEVPEDYRAGNWTRHTLADGYKPPKSIMPGQGAPGLSQTFWPTSDESGKPWVMVTGDDQGNVDLLMPNSEDANDWSYTKDTIIEGVGTIGSPTYGDVNGDGITELFLPLNAKSKCVVFTFEE